MTVRKTKIREKADLVLFEESDDLQSEASENEADKIKALHAALYEKAGRDVAVSWLAQRSGYGEGTLGSFLQIAQELSQRLGDPKWTNHRVATVAAFHGVTKSENEVEDI